ncbi:tRNA epoxyqueuosine(34) reductase QueG [Candidatus Uabimicrobium amorphum]|uniref:Epoxyqueuosine reductase n=1 Tax=Uabimicrobium amorphum TaxID=2596890 RepID=A0A5S9IMV6_UABAM|nr:tRNA epoxyqueuosine(34) reductase QueG [Candidatus Uabimicrobium amorphum]BBM84779.1 Epoxyqueuosine reductase [Candidatus Uabimicrobium amorphum]
MEKTLSHKIKEKALELGFCHVGIAQAQHLQAEEKLLQTWLDNGYQGKMHYMENHFAKRVDPCKLVPGAKSIISVAMNYYTKHQHAHNPSQGKISRYAWGDDYHDVMKKHLRQLLDFICEQDENISGRVFVDSAPIMDKVWAVKSGIGWLGKHNTVISRDYGSWMFLGEVVVNCTLDYDTPMSDHCGSCTRCIDACPTDAITDPYVIDANKCIAYLTIELKPQFDIPQELQPKMDNWIFGCDICQDVCPWNNKFSQETTEESFAPRPHNLNPELHELSNISEEKFRENYRKSPIKRTKHAGLMRNIKAVTSKQQEK